MSSPSSAGPAGDRLPEPAEPALVGRTLARYRIVERLGEGGMGTVFRAWDERLERDVALKVLNPNVLRRADARQRLREEARLLSRLDHPAIATVHDYDTHEGVDFLVLELVRGQTLAERLANGALREGEAAAIGVQVCEALAAAHEHGIIHRDLKPANVMVTVRGHVKVLDFGLATCCRESPAATDSQAVTRVLGLEGTVAYMAPEQLLAGAVDERTDVFSLGVLLYELVTGERPFQGSVLPALTDAVLHRTPDPVARPGVVVSAGLVAVIERCLQKPPELRYPDARSLADDLRRVVAGERVMAPAIHPPGPARDPEAHRAYLRGRRQWSKRTRAGLQLAMEQFESAIDRDPEHAQAWSGLADCYAIMAPWLPPRLGYQKALAAAKRALALEPGSAEALTSLAFATLFHDWDWAQSEALFRRAIALDPGYATSHQWYAELLTATGRFDEALAEARAAEDLDALSYAMPTTIVNVFYYARRYEEALEHHRRMVALGEPNDTLGGIGDRARLLEQSGRAAAAVNEYRAVLALDDDPRLRAGLACALALSGAAAEARAELAALERLSAERHVPPYALAGPLAILGDLDAAFAKLEEAYATRDRAMVYMRINPRFDALRGDARFDSLVARMNFPGSLATLPPLQQR